MSVCSSCPSIIAHTIYYGCVCIRVYECVRYSYCAIDGCRFWHVCVCLYVRAFVYIHVCVDLRTVLRELQTLTCEQR